jgi:hypothetical protein
LGLSEGAGEGVKEGRLRIEDLGLQIGRPIYLGLALSIGVDGDCRVLVEGVADG